MHVAYNMVHPRTLKMTTPWNDYARLERTARAMERKYGLYVDLGMSDYKGQPKGSQKARAFEAQTWQQSFQNHLLDRRDELLQVTANAPTWESLHAGLAEHGVILRRRGNGLVFAQADGPQTMKASLLDRTTSLPALEQRLGAFTPPDKAMEEAARTCPVHRRYRARPLTRHPATGRLWRRYLGERAPGAFDLAVTHPAELESVPHGGGVPRSSRRRGHHGAPGSAFPLLSAGSPDPAPTVTGAVTGARAGATGA